MKSCLLPHKNRENTPPPIIACSKKISLHVMLNVQQLSMLIFYNFHFIIGSCNHQKI